MILTTAMERAKTNDSQATAATCTTRRRRTGVSLLSDTLTIERVASSVFVLGAAPSRSKKQPIEETPLSKQLALPELIVCNCRPEFAIPKYD